MTVPVFEEYEPDADCDCAGCVQQRRALAAGGYPSAHGCRRALVAFTAAGMVLGSGGSGVAAAVGLPAGTVLPGEAAEADTAAAGAGVAAGAGTAAREEAIVGAVADREAAADAEAAVHGETAVGTRGAVPVEAAADAEATGPAGAAVPTAATNQAQAAGGTGAVERGEAAGRQRVVADPKPPTEQGKSGPLHGRSFVWPSGKPAGSTAVTPYLTTPAEIINRAKQWVAAEVPYSMEQYWSDGYRQDCSGYVSMAWQLSGNEWTGSLAQYGTRITREELQPGDILLFHDPNDPTGGSHVTIFGGWTDNTHTSYIAYEQAKPHTRKQATPMAYWSNSRKYLAYRYKGLVRTTTGGPGADIAMPFPSLGSFGHGAYNEYVTELGEMLVARGGKRFYPEGTGPRWGEADRRATEAFQLAQGWRGADADGLPGPATWRLLVAKQGKNIPGAGASESGGSRAAAPTYPGRGHFRPGRSSTYVTQLGRQLVKRGFGKHYTSGPGPHWSEADRRNVEAFQRAQGWRGGAADGYPGPETWRRLFA
jgi:hypothetical protein